jgi:uroporphyrinogen-III synthase
MLHPFWQRAWSNEHDVPPEPAGWSRMSKPVVITRPVAQAEKLARKIAEIGRVPVVFSLLDILSLDDSRGLLAELGRLSSYAMVAFVSPNAIDAFCSGVPQWPPHVAIAVIGEGSRVALARHGLTDANATIIRPHRTDRTDSQTLLEALDMSSLQGREVLIVRGESGRELLGDALRDAGARVTQVAAYRRAAPVLDADRRDLLARLLNDDCDWIITSSEALRILMDMVRQIGSNAHVSKIQHQQLIVPHVRIKESAELLGFQHIRLTGSGDDSLIAALQSPP